MAPNTSYSSTAKVEVDGNELPFDPGAAVVEVSVETDLLSPDLCQVTLLDGNRHALDGIEHGQGLKVSAAAVSDTESKVLFEGEIYALEFESDERGVFSRIVAYDASYRLRQHRVTRSYIDMTDEDIVREIASSTGVKAGEISGSRETHRHLGQLNQTYWEFLGDRALSLGFELSVREGKLNFSPPPDAGDGPEPAGHDSEDPLQLTAGSNLTYLRTRTSSAQQTESVEVRGWDPWAKEQVVATADVSSVLSELAVTSKDLASINGSPVRTVARAALGSTAECEDEAAALAERSASTYLYGEGTAKGDPRLRAGTPVAIGESGAFDGKYTLTSARHVFRSGDYSTHFIASGQHDRSTFAMSTKADSLDNQWTGSFPAIVTDIADPDQFGRVKVALPWLDDTYETDWGRVCQIGAGAEEGILWYPEVGDEVLVTFMAGDPRKPVILGGLYNNVDRPADDGWIDHDAGVVEKRILQSRVGHRLAFTDASGSEAIQIRTGDESITILLDQANGELTITSEGAINVEAQGDLTMAASANVKIEAGAGMELSAGGTFKASGATVEIEGSIIQLN